MRKLILLLLLLLLLPTLPSLADSRITKTYTQRPLPEVLLEIDSAATEIDIRFIYNKLEDYTVTCTLRDASPIEAIQQAVGFYPIKVSQKGATIIVEPLSETGRKLIGRIVDEQGEPLEFANVRLYAPAERTLITGGVTNHNGDFVIPCDARSFVASVSFVGYETLEKVLDFQTNFPVMTVGTLVMKTASKTITEVVVVENDLATTSAEKSSYYPTKRQRNAATDATSLLQHMMIPQLRVNPATGYVTTLAGERVDIFIDYLPAMLEDLAGMNPQDVKRVEVYDYPTDIRFQGKRHVLNFVMQHYEAGGYTKLSSTEMLLSSFTSNNSVYSKLAYKRITFDINLTNKFTEARHTGLQSQSTFRLPSETIVRTQDLTEGNYRTMRPSASLRAVYNSEKMQLSNSLSFSNDRMPRNSRKGTVVYTPSLFDATASEARKNSSEVSSSYVGDWYFSLPDDWALNIEPSLWLSNNRQHRSYREGDAQPIENHIKERSSHFIWSAAVSKTFAQKHSLSLSLSGENYHSAMDYAGSTEARSKMTYFNIGPRVDYGFTTQKFKFNAEVDYCYDRNRMDEATQTNHFPVLKVGVTWAPTNKHSLNAGYLFGRQAAQAALRNANILQENELLYYCGNPKIADYHVDFWDMSYTWLMSRNLSASAFVQQIASHDYFANIWRLHNDGAALIRTFENLGDINETSLGASASLKLLKNQLQLSAYPTFDFYHTSGEYHLSKNAFHLVAMATWYVRQFYIQSYLRTAKHQYDSRSNAWQKARSYFSLTAGWGNAHWKARVDFINPLRTHWRDSCTETIAPLYSSTTQQFGTASHQRLNLTFTYLFNYGKKVQHGNELKAASGGQSSIL